MQIDMKYIHHILSLLLVINIASVSAQSCGGKKYGTKEQVGEGFDYRGQSTFGRLFPGDTSRVKVVLYSKNLVRIFAASESEDLAVEFKIIKTVREYNRMPDKITKTTREEPVYKLDEDGVYIQKYDDWGELEYDEFGDPVWEIEDYKTITVIDTIWRTKRNIREEIIFDSKTSDAAFFEEVIEKTESVIVEVVVPDADKKTETCIAIMVGRKFFSEEYKKFSKSN